MLIFFFNDTATTEIYTLSLHDALPISLLAKRMDVAPEGWREAAGVFGDDTPRSVADIHDDASRTQVREWKRAQKAAHKDKDRKSTRLNSSHANISYAVFCLKKKKKIYL